MLKGIAILFALSFLAACSQPPADTAMTLNRGNGSEIKSLDPHYIDMVSEAAVLGDILIGLTTEDAAGNPIPGAALEWHTSEDGLTWIFKLRDHVWSDGVPVTAHDFIYAFRRLLDPKRGAGYAYNLWVIKNARSVNNGEKIATELGAHAIDDKTLVISLEHPAPYLLELLMHQTANPLPRHKVEALGDAWSKPVNYVGNGPYLPKSWVPNDYLKLVKNQRFYDAKHVQIEVVNYFPTQDSQASLKQMRAGELDTQSNLPATEIIWLRKHMPKALQMGDYMGTSYLTINMRRKPFNDRRVREALSLAYNREVMNEKVLRFDETPAYSLVPPGVANYPGTAHLDFKNMPYSERLKKSQNLMRAAGYGPDKPLKISYHTASTPDNARVAAALQQMWQQIYVDIEIHRADAAVHYRNLQVGDFDIGSAGWIGDFNDASNFLDLLITGGGNNYSAYQNTVYDALLSKAQREPDAKLRGEIMVQAEQIALNDNAVIPTRFPKTQDLVQPYVKGWVSNLRNVNRTRWLWIDSSVPPER